MVYIDFSKMRKKWEIMSECNFNICLPRVNLRQITLLRGYIHQNEQPVVFYHKCFVLSLHIDDFTIIAYAQ